MQPELEHHHHDQIPPLVGHTPGVERNRLKQAADRVEQPNREQQPTQPTARACYRHIVMKEAADEEQCAHYEVIAEENRRNGRRGARALEQPNVIVEDAGHANQPGRVDERIWTLAGRMKRL